MQTKDFHFELPEELIAQVPSSRRGGDRLLVLDRSTGKTEDRLFTEIADIVEPGTLMVFNDSRVRRARVYATVESTGSEAEFLLIAPMAIAGFESGRVWKAMARNAKRQKVGRTYRFADGTRAEIVDDSSIDLSGTEFRLLAFARAIGDDWLERNGHLPLPPYIKRGDELSDADRYQTVYARNVGSVAAPTAGLHFTDETLAALDARGIERTTVTLHVGLGTFLPVRAEKIEEHVMHEEAYSISDDTAERVTRAKREGRPVLAVGTTSIRTLESAWDESAGTLRAGESSTGIFIYPGYRFKVVDRVFTNFHTPESTLLMLVSAFAGKERIFDAYAHAIAERYRFFSYGDSMLIR
jgi:S-adenosylmethionine:tRNA ribosyltransferase-isomerase